MSKCHKKLGYDFLTIGLTTATSFTFGWFVVVTFFLFGAGDDNFIPVICNPFMRIMYIDNKISDKNYLLQ